MEFDHVLGSQVEKRVKHWKFNIRIPDYIFIVESTGELIETFQKIFKPIEIFSTFENRSRLIEILMKNSFERNTAPSIKLNPVQS